MTEKKLDLLELLDWIDPAMLNYSEWTQVGMALKHEGYSASDWEQWSARDGARYHPGECAKKWDSFEGTANPVTGATITSMAKEAGWEPKGKSYDGNEVLDWNSSWTPSDIDRDYKLLNTDYIKGTKLEKPKVWNPAEQMITYLRTLFDPADHVGFVVDAMPHERHGKTKWTPADQGVYAYTAGELIENLENCRGDISKVVGTPNEQAGAWIRFNPLDGKGVKNSDVTEFRYALVESDSMPIEKQNEILRRLELPIMTLTYSAGKSLHAIVRVEAENKFEYQQRVEYLYKVLDQNGLKVDKQNKNPSRLTRFPGFIRGSEKQFLITTDIGKKSWQDWKDYIEDLNDNLPEMENLKGVFDKPIELAPELIHGILRQGHKMLISGPSKAGKSFALIQLAIAIAEGWEWFGFKCEPGRVLYVNLEVDGRSAKKRFVDIYHALGKAHDHVDNIDIWNLRGKTTPMDKLTPKLIRRAINNNYEAVIIDPIYKVLTGDENNAHDMSLFVGQFDKIATELKCAVIYAHHHSKGIQSGKNAMDRSSGSGVFARDPDAILDMIELPVDYPLRMNLLTDTVCGFDMAVIKQVNPAYHVPDDETRLDMDRMNLEVVKATVDLPNKQEILQQVSQQRAKIKQQVHQETAWRLDATLREFPKPDPVNFWFKYPIHIIDNERLADVKLETPEEKWQKKLQEGREKSNQNIQGKKQNEFQQAFNMLLEPDSLGVKINDIATCLEVSRPAIYKRVKKDPNYYIQDGLVIAKEKTNK